MVRPRIRPSAPSAPSALKRDNLSSATMRYGRGGGLGRLRKLGPVVVRRGGCMCMSSRAKPTIICCTLAPPSYGGGLAGMHVWPSQCGKPRTVLHCGTWISPSGRWRQRCCVCVRCRGSSSMRRAYAECMQSTRAEICGECPANRWVNLHEAYNGGDCWVGQWYIR
jgi:hypothetical protein